MQMFLVTIVNQFGEQKAGAYLLDHTEEDAKTSFLSPKDKVKEKKRQDILAQPDHKLVVLHISKGLWCKEHIFRKQPEKKKA